MAEPQAQPQTQTVQVEEKKLKYLDFVQVAVLYAVVSLSSMYEYAKQNMGPLKPGVYAVEGTIKTVIGPVYEKLHDIPLELLMFVDHKMDVLLKEMEDHVTSLLKHAREVASGIHINGLVNTGSHLTKTVYTKYEPVAKELYTKYEPVAENYVVSIWQSLNGYRLFRLVAGIIVPTGVYWAEKYNKMVCYVGDKGFLVAGYLPFVPIEKIGKIFEGGNNISTNGEYVAVEQ